MTDVRTIRTQIVKDQNAHLCSITNTVISN